MREPINAAFGAGGNETFALSTAFPEQTNRGRVAAPELGREASEDHFNVDCGTASPIRSSSPSAERKPSMPRRR